MTNTPKTAESSVSPTATKADGRRVRILSARSAGILALVLAAVVFAIDQGTKYLVVTQMQLGCLLYTSPSPRDRTRSRMPSSA